MGRFLHKKRNSYPKSPIRLAQKNFTTISISILAQIHFPSSNGKYLLFEKVNNYSKMKQVFPNYYDHGLIGPCD